MRLTREGTLTAYFLPEFGKYRGPGFERTNEYRDSLKNMKYEIIFYF